MLYTKPTQNLSPVYLICGTRANSIFCYFQLINFTPPRHSRSTKESWGCVISVQEFSPQQPCSLSLIIQTDQKEINLSPFYLEREAGNSSEQNPLSQTLCRLTQKSEGAGVVVFPLENLLY